MRPFPSLMMMIPGPPQVVPATYYFTPVGYNYFKIPPYNTLTLNIWGAGAGGGTSGAGENGTNGVSSLFYDGITTPTAGGGSGFGSGGTATGGNTNLSGGSSGENLEGGSSPYGGGTSGGHGNYPGGGGAGGSGGGGGPGGPGNYPLGGGGGAFCQRIYLPGNLTIGTTYTLYVGSAGLGSSYGYNGANGEIEIIVA